MINNEGKEMINDYAVQNEVLVGNRRYLFAIHKNDKEPQRFLKCQCYDDDLFRHYVNAVTSNDFVECILYFVIPFNRDLSGVAFWISYGVTNFLILFNLLTV